MHARIAGRPLRVGVFDSRAQKIVFESIFPSGVDLIAGHDEGANLWLPSWVGPNALILSDGHLLHLAPGMRVHMCHDEGEDRVQGEYEELLAIGMTFPFPINVAGLNIRMQEGITLFGRFLTADEPDWNHAPGAVDA